MFVYTFWCGHQEEIPSWLAEALSDIPDLLYGEVCSACEAEELERDIRAHEERMLALEEAEQS